MDLKLNFQEIRRLGFNSIYVWDDFMNIHSDIYEQCRKACIPYIIEEAEAKHQIVNKIRAILKANNFDTQSFQMQRKLERKRQKTRLIELTNRDEQQTTPVQHVVVAKEEEVSTITMNQVIDRYLIPAFEQAEDKSQFFKNVMVYFIKEFEMQVKDVEEVSRNFTENQKTN